ncbi:hypothetical protein SNEBB_008619 [Seison nebaliae]|nr:hypothetical protein SNEBB_008619 [Seison nebaliae]
MQNANCEENAHINNNDDCLPNDSINICTMNLNNDNNTTDHNDHETSPIACVAFNLFTNNSNTDKWRTSRKGIYKNKRSFHRCNTSRTWKIDKQKSYKIRNFLRKPGHRLGFSNQFRKFKVENDDNDKDKKKCTNDLITGMEKMQLDDCSIILAKQTSSGYLITKKNKKENKLKEDDILLLKCVLENQKNNNHNSENISDSSYIEDDDLVTAEVESFTLQVDSDEFSNSETKIIQKTSATHYVETVPTNKSDEFSDSTNIFTYEYYETENKENNPLVNETVLQIGRKKSLTVKKSVSFVNEPITNYIERIPEDNTFNNNYDLHSIVIENKDKDPLSEKKQTLTTESNFLSFSTSNVSDKSSQKLMENIEDIKRTDNLKNDKSPKILNNHPHDEDKENMVTNKTVSNKEESKISSKEEKDDVKESIQNNPISKDIDLVPKKEGKERKGSFVKSCLKNVQHVIDSCSETWNNRDIPFPSFSKFQSSKCKPYSIVEMRKMTQYQNFLKKETCVGGEADDDQKISNTNLPSILSTTSVNTRVRPKTRPPTRGPRTRPLPPTPGSNHPSTQGGKSMTRIYSKTSNIGPVDPLTNVSETHLAGEEDPLAFVDGNLMGKGPKVDSSLVSLTLTGPYERSNRGSGEDLTKLQGKSSTGIVKSSTTLRRNASVSNKNSIISKKSSIMVHTKGAQSATNQKPRIAQSSSRTNAVPSKTNAVPSKTNAVPSKTNAAPSKTNQKAANSMSKISVEGHKIGLKPSVTTSALNQNKSKNDMKFSKSRMNNNTQKTKTGSSKTYSTLSGGSRQVTSLFKKNEDEKRGGSRRGQSIAPSTANSTARLTHKPAPLNNNKDACCRIYSVTSRDSIRRIKVPFGLTSSDFMQNVGVAGRNANMGTRIDDPNCPHKNCTCEMDFLKDEKDK